MSSGATRNSIESPKVDKVSKRLSSEYLQYGPGESKGQEESARWWQKQSQTRFKQVVHFCYI